MKIPTAADIIGFRRTKVVPKGPLPSEEIDYTSQGLFNLSRSMQDISSHIITEERQKAEQAERERKAEQDRIEREAKHKAEEAERKLKHARQQEAVVGYKNAIADLTEGIWADKDIPDTEKIGRLSEAGEHIKGMFAENFGEDAYLIDPIHADAMHQAKRNIFQVQEKAAMDKTRASTLEAISGMEKTAGRSGKDRAEMLRLLGSLDWTGFSEQEKTKITEVFREKTAVNEIEGRISKGDLKGLLKDLQNKTADGNTIYLPDMDTKQREDYMQAIDRQLKHEEKIRQAEIRAEAVERKAAAREMLAELNESIQAGLPIEPSEWVKAGKLAASDPALRRRFEKLKEVRTSEVYQRSLVAKDPMKYGAAALGVKLDDLSLTDPAMLPAQIRQRKELGSKIREMYGMGYTPLLKSEEVKLLQGAVNSNAGAGLLDNLQKLIGKDAMNGIAAQFAGTDPQAAMMTGYIARGRQDIAASISAGQKYMKDKVIKMPKEEDLRTAFEDKSGKAFDGLPQIRHAHYQSFEAIYAKLAAQRGLTTGDKVDKQLAREAFEQAVGSIAKYRNSQVVLPDGYDERRFINFMRSGLTEQYIEERGGVAGHTNKEALRLIKKSARLHTTSRPNTYRVSYLHDGLEYDLSTNEGAPFEIVLPEPALVKPAPLFRVVRD